MLSQLDVKFLEKSLLPDVKITQVAVTLSQLLLVDESGFLYTTASSPDPNGASSRPKLLDAVKDYHVRKVASGAQHALALLFLRNALHDQLSV